MATAKSPVPAVDNSLSLLIVAKAKMNHGLCYMGYEESTNKLVRPLYSAEKDKQCWPREDEFFVGESIVFKVICDAPEESLLPHSDVDVLVDSNEIIRIFLLEPASWSSPVSMFGTLSKLSIHTVGNIFGNENILEDKYVKEGTACPSVGIYSCKGETVELFMYVDENGKQKRRCIIKEPSKVYDLAVTAEDSYQQPKSDDSVLLLLGLGRPWPKPGQPEKERRCYIFVIGMITKPSDSNEPQVDQLAADLDTTRAAQRTF